MSWSVLQSANGTSASGGTLTATYGTNLSGASGCTLIAVVSVFIGSGSTASVKDGAGNSFILIASAIMATSEHLTLWALNTPSGDIGTKPTITATSTGTNVQSGSIVIQEVSGLATGSTAAALADGTAGTSNGTTTGTSIGPPVYGSSSAGEYLLYVFGDDGNAITWTAPAGYTTDAHSINASNNADIGLAYKNSTGGTESGQWSLTSGTDNWGLILVAFQLAAGAASASPGQPPPTRIPPGLLSPMALVRPDWYSTAPQQAVPQQVSPPPLAAIPPGLRSPMALARPDWYPTAPQQPAPQQASAPPLALVPPGLASPMSLARPDWYPSAAVPPGGTASISVSDIAAAEDADAGAFLVAAAVPESDVAAAAETVAISVTVPETDAAAAAEAIGVTITPLPGPALAAPPGFMSPMALARPEWYPTAPQQAVEELEAGGAADALLVSATVPVADSGAAEDADAQAFLVSATVPVADTAAAAESFSMTIAPLPAAPVSEPPGRMSPMALAKPEWYPSAPQQAGAAFPVSEGEAAGAVEAVSVTATTSANDVAGAAESVSVQATVPVADVAAGSDAITESVTAPVADVAGAAEAGSVAASVPVADVAGATEAVSASASVPVADAAGAVEAFTVTSITVQLGDAAGAIETSSQQVTAFFSDVSGAVDTILGLPVPTGPQPLFGTVPYNWRWHAGITPPRWLTEPVPSRWQATASWSRWGAEAQPSRWGAVAVALTANRIAVLMNFKPIAAISLEDLNILWSSRLGGTNYDPTGQTAGQPALVPSVALPVSSGDFSQPAEPSTWYMGAWLTAALGEGYIAQHLIGPGGGAVTLTAGTTYDVWAKLTGGTEVPARFVGQLTAY